MRTIGIPEILVLFGALILVATTVFWVRMLIDCAKNETDEGGQKATWLIVIALTHWVGAAIYYFVRLPQRRRDPQALRPRY